ncbi:DUF7507 domain-containing protein [Actinomadura harenae]|uniref:DUF7507 domain-containing protein n=1 Tax=Actinomadura harenae TaxID=2483351 RepID=UPI00366D0145
MTRHSHAAAAVKRPPAAVPAAVPATSPGSPGRPQPATAVFSENFENRQSSLPIRLNNYTGQFGMTYTADQAWLQNCNGWVAAFSDPGGSSPSVATQVADCNPASGGPGTPGTQAWNHVRQLAQALGVLNGTPNTADNHAVSAYTNGHINNGDPGAGKVEFQTAKQIPLTEHGRFLTFSVNAAETSCDTNKNHALLNFYLVNGASETPVTSQAVNPCTRGSQVSPGFWAGTFPGDAPLLYSGDSVGLKMTNGQGSGNGNDHAFDDVRLMDVTPQLDKAFDLTTIRVGQTSKLTFTITNTSDLLVKSGWSFTDTLPSGLRLGNPANATTTCTSADIGAAAGDDKISVTNGSLAAGQASCTVTVDVTSGTVGTYTNGPSDITDSLGLNPPGESTLQVTDAAVPSLRVEKSGSPDTFTNVGDTLTYTYRVTNTGNVTMNNVRVRDNLPGVSAITCAATTLAAGDGTDCTATYRVTQADVDAGSVHNVAIASGVPEGGTDPVDSPPSDLTTRAPVVPGISIVKLADLSNYHDPGQTITYTYHVTNTGNVALNTVGVTDNLTGLSAVNCPQTTLAVGQSMDCTATYVTTQADVDAGAISNTATAHGIPQSLTEPIVSAPSQVTIPAIADPAITLVKTPDPTTFSAPGQQITYSYLVTNTGNDTLSNVNVTDDLPGISAVTCPQTTLAPNESMTCTATYVTTQQDLDNGSVFNVAVAHGTAPAATEPTDSAPADATVIGKANPGITVAKSADRSSFTAAGQPITYTYKVTNTGNVTLNDVGINDPLPGLSTPTCLTTTLPAGGSTDCTATYTTTQADVDAGAVHNEASAHGTPQGATGPIESPLSEVTVPAVANPSIALSKVPNRLTYPGAGVVITYQYVVTNTGNVTLTDVGITDAHTGLSPVTCPLTTLPPGGRTVCIGTYTTTAQDVLNGEITNTATAHGTPPGATGPTVSAPATATVRGEANPALTIEKSADPTTFTFAGQPITYSYVVTNNGNDPLTDVAVRDDLLGPGAVTCPVTVLNPGQSTTCTGTYIPTQADMDRGSVVNTAIAVGTNVDGAEIDSAPSEAIVTGVPNPSMALVKFGYPPSFSGPGQTITYTYHILNTGDVTLTNVGVTDDLPGLSPITCNTTTLAPGQATDCFATYVTTQADVDFGSVHNVATAHGTPPGGTGPIDSPQAEVTIPAVSSPAITLTKTPEPTTFSAVGQQITYTYRVTNTGNVTLSDVGITDDLPGLGPIMCPTTTLAPGESMDCTAEYVTTQEDLDAGLIHNTATAHGTAPGGTEPTVSAPAEADVTAEPNHGITLAKSADVTSYSRPGETITYTYRVTNTGNQTLTDVGVTDNLPGLTAIECPQTTLAPGESMDCTATYVTTQQDVDNESIHNVATAHGTPPGPGTEPIESPTSEVTIPAVLTPAIEVHKTADPTTFSGPGETITYTYKVTNTGDVTLHNVGVTDDLPGLSPIGCPLTTLAPDESMDCAATYVTTQQDVDNGSIHNTATSHGTTPDGTQTVTSEPSEADVELEPRPAIEIRKSADPMLYTTVGQGIIYSYTVTNTGNVRLDNVGVNDPLTGMFGTTCGAATLNPGESTGCTALYTVTQEDIDNGSIFNEATAHGTAPGATEPTVSEPSDVTVTAEVTPELMLHKFADLMTYSAAGQQITYFYEITNTGNVTLNDVGVKDTLIQPFEIFCPTTTIAPHETIHCTATYIVTQQDVDNGSIFNEAIAHGTAPGSPTPTESNPSDVTVTAEHNPGITVAKSAEPPTFSSAGYVITYSYHVVNDGNVTLHDVHVVDDLPGLSPVTCPESTLTAGESMVCTATYVTTQADLDAGSIHNTAVARGTAPDGGILESPPSDVIVIAEAGPAITIEKTPEPPTFSAPGQQITYTYHVTNTGNVTLTDVGVTDDLPGLSLITCGQTTLAPGETTDCTATYITTPQDLANGKITNTATSHGTAPGATEPTVSPPADAVVTVEPNPGITLAKSASPQTVSSVGEQVTYTYHIVNTGNVTLYGVHVSDDLVPVGCPGTPLPPGEAMDCTMTYTVTQADLDAGSIHNTAVARGSTPNGDTIESPPSEETVLAVPNPALVLQKTSEPTTFTAAGQQITYTYHVTNTGNVTLNNIGITDDLPGVTPATCGTTTLAPGESTDCVATYITTPQDVANGQIRNVATAHGTAPGSTEPTVSPPSEAIVTLAANPGITVAKSATPSTFSGAGETIHYSYEVVNDGNVALDNVHITDSLPGLSPVTCLTTTLQPGASTTCTATYVTTQADVDAGAIFNTATAHGTAPDGNAVDSPPSDFTVLAVPSPEIQLQKSADPTTFSAAGQQITYTYQVTNTGNTTLNNVGITDDLPGVTPAFCPTTVLAPGESTTCTATYTTTQADLDRGSIHNVANAHGTAPGATEPTVSGPSEAVVTAEHNPGITVAKSAEPTTFSGPGQTITYTYVVTNTGNVTLTDVGINDALPGLSGVTCDTTTLPAGGTATCTATYVTTLADLDAGSVHNSATAHGTPPSGIPEESPPSEVTVLAEAAPALEIQKTADPATYSAVGQQITYTYHVVNTGNVTMNNVGITDDLPGVTPALCGSTTLAPGDSTACTATYTVTQADLDNGSVHNVATAHGTAPGATEPTVSGPSEAVVTAVPNPGITVAKSADPSTFSSAGQAITYSYHVVNTGNVTLTDVGVTDDLPGLSAINCPVTTLAAGASTTCTATYVTTQADMDNGAVHNSATAHGTPPGGTPEESPPSDVTVTAVPNPAITVQKTADPTTYSAAGQQITYTYHVTNTGNVTLTDVGVNDALSGVSPVACELTTLTVGQTTTCTATYTTTQADVDAGSITNLATSHGTAPGATEPTESTPDSVTVTSVPSPALTLEKTAEPTTYSAAGQQITYTYHVTNTGNVTLSNVGITDVLPGVSGATCDLTTLAVGQSTDCFATYTTTQQDVDNGSITNSATAHGTAPGATEPTESGPSEATVTAIANPGITVAKSSDVTSFSGPGETITYTYHVVNTGNVTLTNVGVDDNLAGLTGITCDRTTLSAGESATCTATYVTTQQDVDNGLVHNVATAHGTPPSGTPEESPPSEVTVISVPEPAMTVQKSAEPTTYSAAGQTITYTYEVVNTGNVTLHGVGITDALPGLSAIVCGTTVLAPGASTTCTATYVVTQQDVDNGSITNAATAHGTTPNDEPTESEPSEVTVDAVHNPGITVAKSADPSTFSGPNQTITYTYHVVNTGNVTLTNVGVTDALPGLSAVICNSTTLAAGESTDCTATYTTTQADVDAGSIHNVATGHGTPPTGPPLESPPSEDTVIATPNPAMTVTKTAEPTTYSAAGQQITYTYHVTNTGNLTLNNVGVTDAHPGLSAITCGTTTLAPGQSTTCTATYVTTQQDVDHGAIIDSATAHGTPPGATEPIESPPSEETVEAVHNPGITVAKSSEPSEFTGPGQTITYTYHVVNTGNVTLTNVGVTDDLPGLSAVTCDATTLAAGESATCTATYTTTQADVDAGSVHNSAAGHGTPPTGPPLESPPSEVTVPSVPSPAMTVQKTAEPTTFSAAGQTITYTYHLVNTGNVTLNAVGVTDDLPGLSAVTCDTTTLAPGESATCTATYTTTQADVDAGSIHNVATGHGTPPGATEPIESPPDEATVTATASPAMTVTKSAEPMTYSAAGQQITYTYHVTNTGNVTLTNVGITDTHPGLSAVTCGQTTLPAGESTTCLATYVTTQQDVDHGSITNAATGHGTPPGATEPIESPPTEETVEAVHNPGITVAKSSEPSEFTAAGQTITYTYHIVNTGNVTLTNVGVTDHLAGLSAITCGQTTLTAGQSTNCTATYTTTQADVDNGSVHNSATGHGTTPGGEPLESPPSEVTVPAEPNPAMTVVKTAVPSTFSAAGQQITYSYQVTNTGNVTLKNIGITDTHPGLSAITCDQTTLAPGDSATCLATYVTTQQDVDNGSVHNAATGHGTPPGTTEPIESPPTEETVEAVHNPGITVAKSSEPPTFTGPGQTITYTYHVVNTGNVTLAGVGITDALPGLSAITCGTTTLTAGESTDCTATYVTTQADVDAGSVHNIATGHGTPPTGPPLESPPSEVTVIAVPGPAMTVTKSAGPTTFDAAGETITYTYHVTNTGNVTMSDVGITDALPGLSPITCGQTTLAVGESTDCTATYVTTQQDVANGSIHNSATSHGTAPGATEPTDSPPSEVTVTANAKPAISLRKSVVPSSFTHAGQDLQYRYEVTNTGNAPLTNVGVTDALPGLSAIQCPRTTLQPGESVVCTATYRTTQQDVDRGSIHNVATAHGTPPNGKPIESPPSEVTEKFVGKGKISIRKFVHPKSYSRVGQVLHFTYRVTNTGTATLTDVRIHDRLRGLSAIHCPKRTLAPGESMICTAHYRIRKDDLYEKIVRNRAYAQGTPQGTHRTVTSREATAKAYGHIPVTG